jgi:hypothetical protein
LKYYIHSVPGRLRIKTPLIKGKESLAEHIEKFLAQIQGVYSISTNIITGSITINYNERVISNKRLIDILQQRGIFNHSQAITNDQYIKTTTSKAGQFLYRTFIGSFAGQALQGTPLSLLAYLF